MNKQIQIQRLRLRVPAAQAGNPQALAAEVARHLAGAAGGWAPGRVESIRAQVPAGSAAAGGVARSIAGAVQSSMGKRGGKS
ncbi:MAG: hypothetical protein GC160_19745 [Acidobacteria bacterium]|nr:hypothetical protein [Acidobacteriota bacterium]